MYLTVDRRNLYWLFFFNVVLAAKVSIHLEFQTEIYATQMQLRFNGFITRGGCKSCDVGVYEKLRNRERKKE